jgi:hypothetical protein
MTRIHVTSSAAPSARTAFQRKLTIIGVVGTVLPLAVLALMYLLAPLPMTTGTAEILRTAVLPQPSCCCTGPYAGRLGRHPDRRR